MALNRLQYRHNIHKDKQEHNTQILIQDNLTLKFEITVELNTLVDHSLPLVPQNITAQSLPSPIITTELIYRNDRYTKQKLGYRSFYNPYSHYPTHISSKNFFPTNTLSTSSFRNNITSKFLPLNGTTTFISYTL